ncbi:MAG TPA: preprotein translocase subunit SecG [Ignavibacteria bacterium]
MVTFFIIFLVIVCILLMGIVLMQSSKGSGLVGPIAGTGVTTMFGARRASDFLSKSTIVLAVIFMLFSLLLNIYISKSGGTTGRESLIQQNQKELAPGAPPVQEPGNLPGNQPNSQPNQNNQGEGNQQQNPAP